MEKRTIIWEENNEPPKNYIWVKSDGKAYEYNNSTRSWELSKTMSSASNGTDSNVSHVYEVSSLEDIQNPKEGDIAIIPDSWEELTIEPTVTEDNGTITKVYNVESYSANSRIRVTSDPTCFASSYIDSENNSHNSGSVSTNVFPVGTKSITLWETGEFPEVRFYEEVTGVTKEYVNGEWVDRANFSSAIENMSSEEKMQVRKNLGLYYEETNVEEKIAEYTDQELSDTLFKCYKISDDTPAVNDLIKIKYIDGVEYSINDEHIKIDTNYEEENDGYAIIFNSGSIFNTTFIIKLNNSFGHEPGIYVRNRAIDSILYYNSTTTTISKIESKYLPKPVTLLSIPHEDGNSIEGIISEEDLLRLINGESCIVTVYSGDGNTDSHILAIAYGDMVVFYDSYTYPNDNGQVLRSLFSITRIQEYDSESFIYEVYSYSEYEPELDFINLAYFPSATTDTDAIAAMFPKDTFKKVWQGKITKIITRDRTAMLINATYTQDSQQNTWNGRIEFWSATDIYVVTPTAITVTPR